MSDTTDDMEIGAALYEAHLENKYKYNKLFNKFKNYPSRILIEDVIRVGPGANFKFKNFPGLDIALTKYKSNDFNLSEKQRKAFINLLIAAKLK